MAKHGKSPAPAKPTHGKSTAQQKLEAVDKVKAKATKKADEKAAKEIAKAAKADEAAEAKASKAGAKGGGPGALVMGRMVRYVMAGKTTVHPAMVAEVGGFLPDPQGRSHSQVWLEANRDKTIAHYEARDKSKEYTTCALVVFLAVTGTGGTQSRLNVPYAKPSQGVFASNTWHWPNDTE